MKTLTARQTSVLDFVVDHIRQNQRSPSIREVMGEFNIGSIRGASVHLEALITKGYLARDRNQGLRVLKLSDGRPVRLAFVTAEEFE